MHINIVRPSTHRIIYNVRDGASGALLSEKSDEGWKKVITLMNVAAQDVFEIEIPFEDITASENDEIDFSLEIMRNSEEVERCPQRGYITVTVPSPNYETIMWY